jgi:DNA (cytosine-5)-methyltransferase 1
MSAYYNEIDETAAHVLKALIDENVIAPGDVDRRSIKDVKPDDLRGYTQCHFFAGGGLWSVAARLAGWPDDRPLWTGSCPCQPFSQAGQGRGVADERHLWPDFHRLVSACRPEVCVGEQVAGKAGYGWLDGVRADLEAEGYACECADIPSCAVDAPHIRQRLYWVAVADAERAGRQRGLPEQGSVRQAGGERQADQFERRDEPERVADARGERLALGSIEANRSGTLRIEGPSTFQNDAERRNGSFWSDHEWLVCHDGKARRTKSGLRLLVDGYAGRVGAWRIAGNAINPVLAAEVLAALRETIDA